MKYNKLDNKFFKPKHTSLVHVLEDVVLALEGEGMTEQDIFSLVNMIMRGFIREGVVTQEYVALANKAIEHRKAAEEHTGIVGVHGQHISSKGAR